MERNKYNRTLLTGDAPRGARSEESGPTVLCDTQVVVNKQLNGGQISVPISPTTHSTKECESRKSVDRKLRPSQPCPAGHTLPYGLHHWRDCYGNWRCTECDPPAALAMVREEMLVGSEIENAKSKIDDWGIILAIEIPGEPIAFAPNTTQAERKQAAENFEWWDRHDERKNRFDEKQKSSSQ